MFVDMFMTYKRKRKLKVLKPLINLDDESSTTL